MKKLLFSLVVFSALLIIGCQENSIVAPVDTGNVNKDTESPLSGTITLQGNLDNPYPVFNSYFIIDGEINYRITFNDLDPIPPNLQQTMTLQLDVYAELTDYCTVCMPQINQTIAGVISTQTSDVLNGSSPGVYNFTRSFQIQKNEGGMVLVCSFQVTSESVTLEAMWLEQIDHQVASGKSLN